MLLLKWYMMRLMQLVATHPVVAECFQQVQNMLKTPIALFALRIVWIVVSQQLLSRRQKPAVSLPADQSDPQALGNKKEKTQSETTC